MSAPAVSVASNARWAAVSQAGRMGLRLLGLVILSRLLEPADFGLVAMATAVTAFAEVLRDMGTAGALIQRERVEDDTASTVFWFNAVTGLLLSAAVFLLAPVIETAFAAEGLADILRVLAPLYLLVGLSASHQALLERESRFRLLAVLEISSVAIGLVTAVVAALLGARAFSLVFQALAVALASNVLLWACSAFRPRLIWSRRRFGEVWSFSGNLLAFNLVNFFSRNADDLIVGRVLGAGALGVYSLTYRVMMLPLQTLSFVSNRALFPVMSLRRFEPGAIAGLHGRALAMIALVSAPLNAGLWLLREPFVLVVLGEQWTAAVPVLAWLAPVGFIQSLVSTTGTVLKSTGRTDLLLRLGVAGSMLVVSSFLIGVRFGLVGVAACYLVANVLNAILCFRVSFRITGGRGAELVSGVAAPLAGAAVLVLAGGLLDSWLAGAGANGLLRLAVGVPVGGLLYLSVVRLFAPERLQQLRELLLPRPPAG